MLAYNMSVSMQEPQVGMKTEDANNLQVATCVRVLEPSKWM